MKIWTEKKNAKNEKSEYRKTQEKQIEYLVNWVMTLNNVVFPVPFSPTIPTFWLVGITTETSSLEDVFLDLTGKSINE